MVIKCDIFFLDIMGNCGSIRNRKKDTKMAKYIVIKKWQYGDTTMHTVHDDRLCFEDISIPAGSMVGDLLETSSKGKAHMVASHLNAIESVTSRKDGTKITYEVATIEI